MDFHIMKRKELQALCKKHNIPANLTNLEMANNLASLLKEKEKPKIQGRSCLKNMGGMVIDNDSNGVTRQSKKVRFSPENEMIEFVGSEAEPVETKRGARRRSMTRSVAKKGGLAIDNVIDIEAYKEIVENPVRTTRSRAQKSLGEGVIPVVLPVVEKKRTRNGVGSDDVVDVGGRGDKAVPVVGLSNNLPSENAAIELTRAPTRRSLRHREVLIREKSREVEKDFIVSTENQTPGSPKKKNLKTNDEIIKGTGLEADGEIIQPKKAVRRSKGNVRKELAENEVARRGRTTRSQTQMEDYREVLISKKSREVEKDFAVLTENQALKSSKKKNLKTNDEISKDTVQEDCGIIEPENAMRRSKRNVIKELARNEMARRGRTTRSQTQMADNGSAPESKTRTDAEVEVHKKLQMVQQLKEPSRCGVRNDNRQRQSIMPQIEKVGTDGTNIENESRKVLRRSFREGGSRREKLEETDMNSIRSSSRNKPVAYPDGMDRTANTTGKKKPWKRRRDPVLEVNVVADGTVFVEEPPRRRSTRNAAKNDSPALAVGTGKAARTKKQQSRPKLPNLAVEPLGESTLSAKEPPILDALVSKVEIAESSIYIVLEGRKVPNVNTGKNRKEICEESQPKEVSAETSYIIEDKGLKLANSVEILAFKTAQLPNDHADKETLFSFSGSEIDQEKPLEDDIRRVNEDDPAPHPCKRSRESDYNNLVEPKPEEDSNASNDVGFPQATFGDDAHSLFILTDCPAKPSDNMDVGKEMDRDVAQAASHEYIESSGVVAHHGVDDGKASILRGHNLAEFEDRDSVGKPINPEFAVEDHLAEPNENRDTKKNFENLYDEAEHNVVDLSDGERIRPAKVQDIETDVAEKSAARDEEQESSICSLSMQNIEMETLSTTNVSAFKSAPTTDPGLSEVDVTDNTTTPALGSSKEVSEDANIKRKDCSRNSSSKKLHHLMEVCSKSADFDEISSPMMVNLEATPASNSVTLQSNSAEQEQHVHASESLVVTEKENILLVAGNQNFLQGDMDKGDEYDLASRSQIQSGDFEDQDKVGLAAKPSSILTLSGHFETEKPESSNYTESRGVSEVDYAAEDDKCSALEVQKFIEFQEVHRFSEPSTPERISVCHSIGPDERQGAGEDCENTSENGVDITALDPCHGERITASECKRNTDLVEVEEKSKCDTGVHHETMSYSDAFSSDEDNICSYKKIEETLAERENQHEGLSSVEITLHPVDEETGYEFLEGSSSRDGCVLSNLNELDGQLRKEKKISCFETYSIHNSEKIEEASTAIFTNGSRILISMERDTDEAQDTVSPIITKESSLVANNVILSFECTSLKDDNESGQEDELKSLFATPANDTKPSEEAAYSHEMDGVRMQEGSTISNVKHGKINNECTPLKDDNESKQANDTKPSEEAASSHEMDGVRMQEGSIISNVKNGKINHECTPLKDDNNSTQDEFKTSFATPANDTKPSEEATSSHEMDSVRMQEGSTISNVKNEKINHESISLKDDIESGQEDELKTLFATPPNDTKPSEEAASSHEVDGVRMQEGSSISNVKNGKINHEEPWEIVGLTENNDEKMACKNAAPTANEEVTGECSDVTADAEYMGVDGNIYTAFDWFIYKDGHVGEEKESHSSRIYGNASKEDTSVEALQLVVQAGIAPTSEREIDKTEYPKEACEGKEIIAKSHGIGADIDCQCSEATIRTTRLEYQALGTSDKGMSFSELRISVDNEMRNEGMGSSSIDFVNVSLTQPTSENDAKDNGKSIEGDLQLECSKLDINEVNVEYLPDAEYWDSSDCKELVAQVNGRSDAGLVENPFKEHEVSERKIIGELIKSTSKCINGTHLLKERENEGAMAPLVQLGVSQMVLDHGVGFAIRDANSLDASDMLSDKDAKENVVLDLTEYDHKDSDIILREDMNNLMLDRDDEMNQNDSKIGKDELVANRKENKDLLEVANIFEAAMSQVDEVNLMDFGGHNIMVAQKQANGSFVTPREFVSANHEYGEDEISVDIAETKLQVKEMELDDLESHQDGAIMERDLNIINNSYAEEDVYPGYFSYCLEHEKVMKRASHSQLDVPDSDGQESEPPLHHGDLSSDAEGREMNEVDQADLLDDCDFTVLCLVSKDCNEDRGNASTSMDKSFQEDKDAGMEKVVGDTTDGSNIEENVASKQKSYEEQLVGNEDAPEEDAFVDGTMGYGTTERLESNMFSCWEMNLFLGDELMNSTSEISEAHFTREDSAVASVTKENVNDIVLEHQFRDCNHLMEGKVAEPNGSCLSYEESIFKGDEVLNEEKDAANNSNDCRYPKNELVEAEKSSILMHDVILTDVSNPKGNELAASIDSRVEGDSKSSEEGIANTAVEDAKLLAEEHKCEERVGESTEMCENAQKAISIMDEQSSQSTNSAVDRGVAAKDLQMWQPNSESELSELKVPVAKAEVLNSTTMKRKNAQRPQTSRIQGTPKKPLTDLDMKENETSIKGENLGSTIVRSTTKRRALVHLQNQ